MEEAGVIEEGVNMIDHCARIGTKESCSKLPLLPIMGGACLCVGMSTHLFIYVYVSVITLPFLCPYIMDLYT